MDMVKDEVVEKDGLLAIQESLVGFLLDDVVNLPEKHYYDRSKNYCDAPPLGVETKNLK
jgi:hypothetical protein